MGEARPANVSALAFKYALRGDTLTEISSLFLLTFTMGGAGRLKSSGSDNAHMPALLVPLRDRDRGISLKVPGCVT